MKKIVFVCNHLFGGGAERVLVSLANYFVNKGYIVTIIVFDGKKRYHIEKEITVIEIGDSSSLLKQSKAIRKELISEHPDIVIAFEYFVNLATIIAARGLNLKVIVSERNDPARIGSGFGKDQIRNYLYKHCDTVVCQTPDAKAYFPKNVQTHSVVIPNPIKNDLPQPWYGERNHLVVNFCRLNEQKNLKLLIDAFLAFLKHFPDYKMVIYGDGPEKDEIIEYIKLFSMDDAVTLLPNCADVHERVIKSSMFVSSSDYEGLSNSMLEAMAIGLPTICTDCPCGGARMIIKNGENGLIVPAGDRVALTEAMKKIAMDQQLSRHLSREAQKIRTELSLDNIAERWESLF